MRTDPPVAPPHWSVEGGIWTRGRHTRGKGYEKDCQKYNEAALLGFRVLRVTTGMVASGEALNVVERAIQTAGNGNG